MRFTGRFSVAPPSVLAEGAKVTVGKGVVKDAKGNVVGRIESGRVQDGEVYAVMEITDNGMIARLTPEKNLAVSLGDTQDD